MFAAKNVLLTIPSGAPPASSVSYPSFSSRPTGSVDVAQTAGAGAAIISGATLQEGSSTASNGGYNSLFVLPDVLSITATVSITVTVGALSVVANNRAVGCGIASADGSKAVYIRFASQSSTASINSWAGGTETSRGTSTQLATAGDTLTLTGTLSAGVWTWTVKKNGGADIAALTWADSTHAIDLPGYKPAIAFRHQYASGQAPSRGVAALSATAT